jgi:hypothetical protein
MAESNNNHKWRFFRAGGVDQVRIDTGADIVNLQHLDQKLWIALSCPVAGSEFDEKTLALLDSDKDGHVRVPEVKAACKWVGSVLKNADGMIKGEDGVPLSVIDDSNDEGRAILASAKQILVNLGKSANTSITIADAMETEKIFSLTPFNGDGVVPPGLIEDAGIKKVATDLIDCVGSVQDRSGKPGYDTAKLDEFFAELQAFSAWSAVGEKDASVLAFGKDTAAVAAAISAVRAKVDDFFGRCRLAAFDPRAASALNTEESAYLKVAAQDMNITADEVKHFPLAIVEAEKSLPLSKGVNPAWSDAIAKFAAATGLAGKASITEAEWLAIKAKVAPYDAWASGKAGAKVEKLGIDWVRQILDSGAKDALADLVTKDKALEAEMNTIAKVEKLTRLYRDLHQLLCNFVSFTDFYSQRRPAIFQNGTLYLDSRATDLCMAVNDAGRHGNFAIKSGSFLAYCDCTRPGGEKMSIAAAVTDGDSDELFVGRNCIFYDRKGRDWNAQITKIVDQPISIRQAFFSPYKKFVRMVEEMIAKRAAAADADADKLLTSAADTTANADKKLADAAAKPPGKFDIGLITGIGVALGSMAAAFSGVLNAFFGPGKNPIFGVLTLVIVFVVIISGPSMLLAYMKLRKRNLGPLLDANGWAINTPVKINVPFGAALTHLGKLPAGAERSTEDPYAVEPSPWIGKIKKYVRRAKALIILAILLLIAYFVIDRFGPYEAKKSMYKLLGRPVPPPETVQVTPPAASAPAAAPAVEKAK